MRNLEGLAAGQGNANAQYNLGVMYYKGLSVTQHYEEAVRWYLKAALKGHSQAQNNLGVMYVKGEGVPQEPVTAYAWWNIAAANGNTDAATNKARVAKQLTPAQITAAQELSKEMLKKYPKLLNK